MDTQKKSFVFALTAVLLWSTVASAFKISLRYLSPIELLLFATITSIVVLSIILVCQGKFLLLIKMTRKEWLLSAQLGLLNPFLYYLILLYAYDVLPAQKAQAINYTWAITLSLLSVPLLKQTINRVQLIAVVIGYSGVIVIGMGGTSLKIGDGEILGIFLAVVSTIVWSLYWIFNTKDTRDPVVGLLANFICGLILILLVYVVSGSGFSFEKIDTRGLLGALYVGTFEMGVAFVFWLMAMKKARETVNIANLIFLSPVLSLFFIYFLVGETILITTILGLGLILTGLGLQIKAADKKVS